MSSPTVTLHSTGEAGFIGRLTIPPSFHEGDGSAPKHEKPQQVVILDRSGSMGQWVPRLVNIVIPQLAQDYLGMAPDDPLTLITFDSIVEKFETTVDSLRKMPIRSRGCTYMKDVYPTLQASLSNPNVNILAISDGQVWDNDATMAAAELAAPSIKDCRSISATAVRLFTSSCQPDTRALASVLMLNTSAPGSIIDVPASPDGIEGIARAIGDSPSFTTSSAPAFELVASAPVLSVNPWDNQLSSLQFHASPDQPLKTFFLGERPSSLTLNGVAVVLETGTDVTIETLSFMLGDKLDHVLSHLRVLKVVNSSAAKDELSRVTQYFQDLEASLPPPGDLMPLLQDGSLAKRVTYMKGSLQRKLKSVSLLVQQIANDDKVAKLNHAQQADYLRQATGAKTSRAMARRAVESGLDFDGVMRAEILAMAAHQDELNGIDDSEHAVSFFSRATTLDGISCMIDLASEPDVLENLTAPELLRLFNVVGIPAYGPVGEFPDPMSYRLNKFLPGAYVSMADVQMAWSMNNGALTVPGHSEAITNAIPFFENDKIQMFLQRYARSSLEFIASIGCRRLIADVPKTYPYTICAGLWRMIEEFDTSKTELNIKHFQHLAVTYEKATQGMFDHVLPLLTDHQAPRMSFDLKHNGITNLLGPMLHLTREGKTQNMDRILRALFSFELYQACRRLMRDTGMGGRTRALDALLGIDFQKNGTPLPDLFTRTKPNHCTTAVVNAEALKTYTDATAYVRFVTLAPSVFKALVQAGGDDAALVSQMRNIPAMTPESIAKALNLQGLSLDDFMLYTVVEGLLHANKQSRIDKETDKPLLGDLGIPGVGSDMIAGYVRKRYAEDYEARLHQQLGNERGILRAELIGQLLAATDIDTFVSLLAAGNSRGPASVAIDRDSCPGFDRLHKALLDANSPAVPVRVDKLKIVYTGRTPQGKPAFNGGNLLRTSWEPLGDFLTKLGSVDEWDSLQKELAERRHQYREQPNRHGHHNQLPSYFAFRCLSLEDYRQMVDDATWLRYTEDHADCCGVRQLLYAEQLV